MTQHPERPTCATCPYWESFGGSVDDGEGECRRYPPRIIDTLVYEELRAVDAKDDDPLAPADRPMAARLAAMMRRTVAYTPTFAGDWCGEHHDFTAWIKATRPS